MEFNREASPALDSNAAACLGLLESLYGVKEFLASLGKCYGSWSYRTIHVKRAICLLIDVRTPG